jgi:hypothetical protein
MLEVINMFERKRMKKGLIDRSAVKKKRQATKDPDQSPKK